MPPRLRRRARDTRAQFRNRRATVLIVSVHSVPDGRSLPDLLVMVGPSFAAAILACDGVVAEPRLAAPELLPCGAALAVVGAKVSCHWSPPTMMCKRHF